MVKSKAIFLSVLFIIALLLPVSAATLNDPADLSETDPRLVYEPMKETVNASQLFGTTPETDFVFLNGTIVKYIGTNTIVDIPDEIDGEKVLHIGDSAFYYTSVVSVTIPEGVTDIGYYAFFHCTSLSYVSMPSTITVIYDYAFSDCTVLTSINLPENLKVIGDNAFMDCHSLPVIVIPNSVVYMGMGAFHNCTALKNVVLSDKLTRIEPILFQNCTLLKSIVLPNSVTYVGSSAFSSCYALENVILSDQLARIESYSFFDCMSLKSIILPDSVTYVGSSAFEGCENVDNLILSKNLTFINDRAFAYAENVESIKLPNVLTYIGQFAFGRCSSLKSIVIPSGVITLRENAFSNNNSLESAYFLGNAPAYWGQDMFEADAPGFTIYYLSESIGFTTPTFRDYQSVCQYKVGILETTGGTITSDEYWAASGKTVTLTVSPRAGCITSSVYYTDIYGTHTVTGSFVMPDSDVEVGAVFTLSVGSWILIVVMAVLLTGLVFYLARPRQWSY